MNKLQEAKLRKLIQIEAKKILKEGELDTTDSQEIIESIDQHMYHLNGELSILLDDFQSDKNLIQIKDIAGKLNQLWETWKVKNS